MLQLYQGQAIHSKDLLLTPAASVVRTVVKWRIIGSLRNDDSGWLKNELIFYLRISRYFKVMYFLSRCQNISKLNMEHSVKLEMEVLKGNSRRRSRSTDNAKLGHFTLLFCRFTQRNLQRFFLPSCTAVVLLSNVLFRFVPVPALIFLNCLASRCSQDGSWNNKSIF